MILTVTLNAAVDYNVFGPKFQLHATNRGIETEPEPGGKANNAARIAHLLGCEVTATGIVGGFTGEFIRSRLEGEGIHTDFLTGDGSTRVTIAFIESDLSPETKIVPWGPEISEGQVDAFRSHFEGLLAKNRFSIIAVSGSLPRGAPDDLYVELVEIARQRSVPVVLDTSGEALRLGCDARPYMITPNRGEAAELSGSTEDSQIFNAMKALASNIDIVALTLGGEGAVFFTGTKAPKIRALNAEVVNPVGAGDAFVGGFIAAFDKFGEGDESAFRWAVAAGTCTAGIPGYLWPRSRFDRTLEDLVVEESVL